MARKTIKDLEEKIAELENNLNEYRNIINSRNKQIEQMESRANDSFENSPEYKRMCKNIEHFKLLHNGNEMLLKSKEETIKRNSETIQKLLEEKELLQLEIENLRSNNVKVKNERGAGRKERFSDEEKTTVKMLRLQGKSYRAIAKELDCSVATVHKIINEQ